VAELVEATPVPNLFIGGVANVFILPQAKKDFKDFDV